MKENLFGRKKAKDKNGLGLTRKGKTLIVIVLLVLGTVGYWLLPFEGKLLIVPDDSQNYIGTWPHITVEPLAAKPGQSVTLSLSDVTAWPDVKLLVANHAAQLVTTNVATNGGISSWQWRFNVPIQASYGAVFYRNCQSGCLEQARFELGAASTNITPTTALVPTKLGVVFADPQRDWHGRSGWDVELTYSQLLQDPDFSLDAVAEKVLIESQRGLRVLVRIDYDKGQSLPAANDETALAQYLAFCARLARDARFKDVYGYIIGSSFNRLSLNSIAPAHPVTAAWYARIFNGYSLATTRSDNVVQTFHALNPHVRVLVGPITPWMTDQSGPLINMPATPWLNYMNSLVNYINASTTVKETDGFSATAPDGFAVQAPGKPEAATIATQEPSSDVYSPEWGNAQFGFRVYRDWLNIINSYATTRGLPLYLTAVNTYTPDLQLEPAQNYPAGWLTNALTEIEAEPQVQALCWYTDLPYDKWANYSLKAQLKQVKNAALEFNNLLLRISTTPS